MLIRTDPGSTGSRSSRSRATSRSRSPRSGSAKINAANQIGGPALALRTVKDLTGLDVNHVAFVDFDRFRELIDAVGGIDVVVPRPIRSNRFDCPYATAARCAQWPGWRFEKGTQHMDGQRALVYSRIRRNLLDPSETDFDRARRQQQVVQATLDKVTSVGTALKLPFVGEELVAPLATDLSAWAADAARLGLLPRRHGRGAPLPARRRPGDRRRRVGHPRHRGQRRDGRDVHGPLGAAAARRAACPTRRAASSASGRRERRLRRLRASCRRASRRSRRPSVLPAAVATTTPPLSPSFAALARATAVVGRVEAGALEVHRDGEQDLLDGARAADSRRPRPAGRSSVWKTSNVWPFGQRYS